MATQNGGTGNDILNGTLDNDIINGLGGSDQIYGSNGDDVLDGGEDNDYVTGGAGDDHLIGGAGDDWIYEHSGSSGDDLFEGGDGRDIIDAYGLGDDKAYGQNGDDSIGAYRQDGDPKATLLLDGGADNDTISFTGRGRFHDDVTAIGGAGNDEIGVYDAANAVIDAGAGDDKVSVELNLGQNSQITLGAGKDTLVVGGRGYGNDIWAKTGVTVVTDFKAGSGGDILDLKSLLQFGLSAWDQKSDPFKAGLLQLTQSGADTLLQVKEGGAWITLVTLKNVALANISPFNLGGLNHKGGLNGTAGDDILYGTDAAETFKGGLGNDTISSAGGDDVVYGQDGNDTLSGYTGDDRLDGGAGDDILGDQIPDADRGQGTDTYLGGDGDDTITDYGFGDDVLDGGAGDDNLIAYRFDDAAASTLTLSGGEGVDYISYNGILRYLDTVKIDGGAGDDVIHASGGGSTVITAGAGDDRVDVDVSGGRPISVTLGDGSDTVGFWFTTDEGASVLKVTDFQAGEGGDKIDLITLLYGGGNTVTTTDWGDNPFETGQVRLVRAGTSTLVQYDIKGDGVFVTAATLLNVDASALTAFNFSGFQPGAVIEPATDGNDVFKGTTGADAFAGGMGNDSYWVNHAGDKITESATGGTDTVHASISYGLGATLENLTLVGTAAINGSGNALNNVLTGNAANNKLDGKAGADTMAGGLGNDTYVVDNAKDVVNEANGAGTDTVQSYVSYSLAGRYVENITLVGTAATNAIGNSLANVLVGNAANNVLDGSTGADKMSGGLGNDIYVVDNAKDVVAEAASAGTDTVQASVSWTLGANIEALTLTGSAAINGVGNTLANTITGNAGANIIDGGAGNDVLTGGAGGDRLIGGAGNDRFVYGSTADSTVAASDRIVDLAKGDVIDLRGVDANTTAAGDQGFALVQAFTGKAGQMIKTWDAAANQTTLSMDVNGDGKADMMIRLDGDHRAFDGFLF